ncbi:ABC transporter permease [Gordonia zhaorongruii]|uniref:ABC transporter permease n=1 Tax=Gordonia zhaorongruii TaxID=2597659 RepID=UPI00164251A7|nr:ABC transporter permease subunit [Gordonia zhaorongruii]
MNLTAVSTVASLEVRQRIRTGRWRLTIVGLFILMTLIVLGSLYVTLAANGTYEDWSRNLLDLMIGMVLFLGLVAAPTVSATSINGDRRDATLALVQATPITSWELALGKLVGSWAASLTLIVVALPYLIWGIAGSPASVGFGILAVLVVGLLMGCYCAIGLGFSAATTRPAASAILTQAAVLGLLIGSPIAFGLSLPLTQQTHRLGVAVSTPSGASAEPDCRVEIREKRTTHTEGTWWLLVANPVLIVSDTLEAGVDDEYHGDLRSASGFFAQMLSDARSGPMIRNEDCSDFGPLHWGGPSEQEKLHSAQHIGSSWYAGLAVSIILGTAGMWTAARRLRVPAARLPKGVRVA